MSSPAVIVFPMLGMVFMTTLS